MSKIGSLFGKKKRKEKEEQPSLFNGLYSFNNQNIVMNSQTSEEILHGSSISDTLFWKPIQKPLHLVLYL